MNKEQDVTTRPPLLADTPVLPWPLVTPKQPSLHQAKVQDSIVVGNASITLRLPDIFQEGATIQLDEHGVDLLLVVDQEHVDAADP